ncbi:MAG: hypothetical protein AAF702_16040 [Chloroflexota bacterium]
MLIKTISRKQRIYLLVGVLALLLVAALLWSNSNPGGLFGTAVNTSAVVVENSECGARRSDVCIELDFNHEIVLADTDGMAVEVGYRVQALVNNDLSRATITNVIGTGSSNQPADDAPEVAQNGETTTAGSAADTVQDPRQNLVQPEVTTTHIVLLPLVMKG